MSTQSHWDKAWGGADPQAKSWFQDAPALSLRLIDDCAIARGEAIIDVGGGASLLVDALMARKFQNISVLDISKAALQSAQARLADRADYIKWLCADATDWTPAHPFRLWHDRAVFHFLTDEADQARYRAIAEEAILPGGYLVMATFALDGPQKCSNLPVVRYDAQSMAATLGPAFKLVDEAREDHTTPGGMVQEFQYCRFLRI